MTAGAGSRTPDDRVYLEVKGRQAYGARLLGTNPRTKFEREWCHRRSSLRGVRGLWVEIGPEPGWYETQTLAPAGYRLIRSYWAYEGNSSQELEPVPDHRMPTAVTGPAPGSPGAWYGWKCACGAQVEHYTAEGWPRCSEHLDQPYTKPARKPRPRKDAAA